MSRPLPELIDPLRLVNKQSGLRGSLAVDRLRQLKGLLCSSEGEIQVDVTFGRDQNGQANIKGEISAKLWLTCQRCLQPMCWQKQISVCLALLNTESEIDKLPPHYEPLFLHEELQSVAEMVEAEIILALPQIAMHSIEHCVFDKRHVSSANIGNASIDETENGKVEKDNLSLGNVTTNKGALDPANEKYNPFVVLQQIKKKE